MFGKDYDIVKRRYLEYWNRENHDTPLVSVYARERLGGEEGSGAGGGPNGSRTANQAELRRRWLDTEASVAAFRRSLKRTYCGGDAYPCYNPNLGPDIIGAICGCDLEFGEETSWAVHCVDDWADYPPIAFDENNFWFKKIAEITKAACDDSCGDYLVNITDLHPGMDALVSLRGPEQLCLDMADCPDEVISRVNQVHAVHTEVYNRLESITSQIQRGTCNWMGAWYPDKRWYVTSEDFTALISGDDAERFVLPHIMAELDFLDASIFHLDGPTALHHLDRLLQLPNLNGVQWVYGAGQPTARFWPQVLTKIQRAGKLIDIFAEPDDLAPLCELLEPEGLHIHCGAANREDADAMLAMVARIYKDKRNVGVGFHK